MNFFEKSEDRAELFREMFATYQLQLFTWQIVRLYIMKRTPITPDPVQTLDLMVSFKFGYILSGIFAVEDKMGDFSR